MTSVTSAAVTTGGIWVLLMCVCVCVFQFIENLHGCQRLQVLNLNHNMIQRMERLNALTQLRELQLAHNNIQ